MRKAFDPVEKLTDCKLFQSLTSKLISPTNQIQSSNKGVKAACGFAAFIASEYRISTKKL
jgi:hypothetical protein